MTLIIDLIVIIVLITGIWLFREPRRAKFGNLMAAFALTSAFVLVLYRNGIVDAGVVVISLLVGATTGYAVARAVSMIQIPAMVAFQHGAGGVAAFLVALVELTRSTHALDAVSEISGVLGLTIGGLTFSASMVASAKLANRIRQTPQILPGHNLFMLWTIGGLLIVGISSFYFTTDLVWVFYFVQILLSVLLGILFSIRIGGADMPVLISFLNATAGLAASFCGMVIGNQLLIAFGATVAASGSILTHVMCKAMNRNLFRVFFPKQKKSNAALMLPGDAKKSVQQLLASLTDEQPQVTVAEKSASDNTAAAVHALASAKNVVIIPGYGMALAKAQFDVVELASLLEKRGTRVKYAIHPVAGRMPGHMNVLLAEAEIDYDNLLEMEEVNTQFANTDVAMVFGACDVVNTAAIQSEGTPISGMPILMAHEARKVIICNFDKNPGYSGVMNPLYDSDKAIMMLGDAKASAKVLISSLRSATAII